MDTLSRNPLSELEIPGFIFGCLSELDVCLVWRGNHLRKNRSQLTDCNAISFYRSGSCHCILLSESLYSISWCKNNNSFICGIPANI